MKKRILFVDDDAFQLQMYAMMLQDERHNWEVVTASDGPQALQLMDKRPFEVVVSDLMMPRMDGAAFMTEVRKRHPRSARIILSVLGDQQKAVAALDSTHQFIAKPFDVGMFKATLARICALDDYLKNEKLQALASQLGALPSFPSLYLEVMRELGSPDSSIENIAAIIATDPAMTAKMLQIVNSAAIGLTRKIGNACEAIEFLGFGTVRSLVLSAHIFACFERSPLKGLSLERLWDHALKTGAIARMIMQLQQADPSDIEDAYTAGMLHDVGKLMLANSLPKKFERALALAAENKAPLHEAEMEVFGATHAGVAAYLLGLWGLPATIVEAVAFHHAPARGDHRAFSPLAAVHAANVFEHELSDRNESFSQLDDDYLVSIGLHNRVYTWRAEAKKICQS